MSDKKQCYTFINRNKGKTAVTCYEHGEIISIRDANYPDDDDFNRILDAAIEKHKREYSND